MHCCASLSLTHARIGFVEFDEQNRKVIIFERPDPNDEHDVFGVYSVWSLASMQQLYAFPGSANLQDISVSADTLVLVHHIHSPGSNTVKLELVRETSSAFSPGSI